MEKVATEDRKLKKMIESIYAEHEQKKLILADKQQNVEHDCEEFV